MLSSVQASSENFWQSNLAKSHVWLLSNYLMVHLLEKQFFLLRLSFIRSGLPSDWLKLFLTFKCCSADKSSNFAFFKVPYQIFFYIPSDLPPYPQVVQLSFSPFQIEYYNVTRPCTTVRDSEDILEQSPFQKYTTCWVFLALYFAFAHLTHGNIIFDTLEQSFF